MAMKPVQNQIIKQPLRAAAEIQLARAAPAFGSNASTQSMDELLHELQVHQIELEMQNEELRRAHTELEISCDRYMELYDFAPIGYLSLNGDGLVTEANLTCMRLLGITRDKLIKRRFACRIAPEDQSLWQRHFMHAKQNLGKHDCELTLCRGDGSEFEARLDCLNRVGNDIRSELRIAVSDITESKRAAVALHIAAAFESTMGIIVTDAHKIILSVNQAFSRITGYYAKEVVGRNPRFLRSGVHGDDFYKSLWAAVTRDGYWQGEIWDKRKNGETFPASATISAVVDDYRNTTHYVASLRDITVQKQAEKVLLNARQRLETQAATSQDELTRIKEEAAEINTALNVLLKHREIDKSDAQNALSHEIGSTVLPFLEKLKKSSSDRRQTRLIETLENNLQAMVKAYGNTNNLSAAYRQLTPTEVQVASMVRQGLSTKLIASTLNLATGTVHIHRKHIRRKLGLGSKAINLYSYLIALVD